MMTRDEDFVQHLFVASTHAYVLFFTNKGRVHWVKVHALPQLGRAARGKAIVNVLQLAEGEVVQTMLPVRSFGNDDVSGHYILLCTRNGLIKKTSLNSFANPRKAGIIAINLTDGDELIAVGRTNGDNEIILATRAGKSIRFPEDQVRPMGRSAAGVRGVALNHEDKVVGMEILSPDATILTVTENGYGKRTPLDNYRVQRRGGQGIIAIRTNERNGQVVGIAQVVERDELMLITSGGKVLRCPVNTISTMGRATQGVRVMNLDEGEVIVSVEPVADAGVDPDLEAEAAIDTREAVDAEIVEETAPEVSLPETDSDESED
jgi:DNA gyrase subunit A